ncbi:hypothetical protein MGYG_09067 [Nannizzia gypsea CBS 118893]|uniref:Uncharacterized protein n=1 Tax=Arthroderma gypseum (strain ATCC MYA-4604 / CBS 118893) TaxID=535722 RepID=E4UX56_ARTGP|nr:hypothetical protein MGYG_09067 [Nannizzia gypsea CBS 118893]EFR01856.1 hypothetical protein MGYG_09067 [Nannizzia gypsea CBS 118893]
MKIDSSVAKASKSRSRESLLGLLSISMSTAAVLYTGCHCHCCHYSYSLSEACWGWAVDGHWDGYCVSMFAFSARDNSIEKVERRGTQQKTQKTDQKADADGRTEIVGGR